MILAGGHAIAQHDSACHAIDLRLRSASMEMEWACEYRSMATWSIGVGAMFVLADRLNNPDSDWRYSAACGLVSFTAYVSFNALAGRRDRRAAHVLSGQ